MILDIEMGVYPLSIERAKELLKKENISDSFKEYLFHVLNNTLTKHYSNRVQFFLSCSDFVAEGDYSNNYASLIEINKSHDDNDSLLARANIILGIKGLLHTIVEEQLIRNEAEISIINEFLNTEFNALAGESKGKLLTTKEEVKYIREILIKIETILNK